MAGDNRWIDAPVTCRTAAGAYPVVTGSIVINAGATLMHLTRGRVVATLHRVNSTLIPPGETRVSMPYFLLPTMEGPLEPFFPASAAHATETGYQRGRDRGSNAAVNRMFTFPSCTRIWWKEEFQSVWPQQAREILEETQATYELAEARKAKASAMHNRL